MWWGRGSLSPVLEYSQWMNLIRWPARAHKVLKTTLRKHNFTWKPNKIVQIIWIFYKLQITQWALFSCSLNMFVFIIFVCPKCLMLIFNFGLQVQIFLIGHQPSKDLSISVDCSICSLKKKNLKNWLKGKKLLIRHITCYFVFLVCLQYLPKLSHIVAKYHFYRASLIEKNLFELAQCFR